MYRRVDESLKGQVDETLLNAVARKTRDGTPPRSTAQSSTGLETMVVLGDAANSLNSPGLDSTE